MEVVRDPGRMSRMAVINWRKSHEFHSDILHAQRRAFSEAVRACAEVHAAER